MKYIKCYNTREACNEAESGTSQEDYRDKVYQMPDAQIFQTEGAKLNATLSFEKEPDTMVFEGPFLEKDGDEWVDTGDELHYYFVYTPANDSVTFGDHQNIAMVTYTGESCGSMQCLQMTGATYNYEIISYSSTTLNGALADYFSFRLSGDSENVVYNSVIKLYDDSGNTVMEFNDFYPYIFSEDFSEPYFNKVFLFSLGVGEDTGSSSSAVTCLTLEDPEMVYVRETEEVLFNCFEGPQPTPPTPFELQMRGLSSIDPIETNASATQMYVFSSRTVDATDLSDLLGETIGLKYGRTISISFYSYENGNYVWLYDKSMPVVPPSGTLEEQMEYFYGDLGYTASDSSFPQSMNGKKIALVPVSGDFMK